MKKLLLLLAFITPQLIFAQQKSSIDITAGVNYAYRTLNTTSDNGFTNIIFYARQDREEAMINWTVGVHYNKQFSNAWYGRTGLRFTNIGYNQFPIDEQEWPSQNNNGMFDPTIENPDARDIIVDYYLLEIPILVGRQFCSKKWAPFIEVGISPSYIVGNSQDIFASAFTRNFQVVGIVSGGLNYTQNSFQFFAQPAFRFHLTGIDADDPPIKEHLFSGGIEVGVRKFIGEVAN